MGHIVTGMELYTALPVIVVFRVRWVGRGI